MDWNVFIVCIVNYYVNMFFIIDIVRVNMQIIDVVFCYFQCNVIVEVDVSYQWYVNLLFDEFECFCCVYCWYGYMDDISVNVFQCFDLIDCCFDVCCMCIGYGLYGDGSIIVNWYIFNVNMC